MKLKNIDFTHEARATIIDYLDAKATAKKAVADEKAKKVKVEEVFANYGWTMTDKAQSSFIGGFIQQSAKRIGVVFRKTWNKGTVDWKAYALSLGGTDEGAENFRKDGHWTTACDKATADQLAELEQRI